MKENPKLREKKREMRGAPKSQEIAPKSHPKPPNFDPKKSQNLEGLEGPRNLQELPQNSRGKKKNLGKRKKLNKNGQKTSKLGKKPQKIPTKNPKSGKVWAILGEIGKNPRRGRGQGRKPQIWGFSAQILGIF